MSGGGNNSGLTTALGIGAAIAAPELLPELAGSGIGTSALTGAALGAGSSALTGKNVMQGALAGGALGAGAGWADSSLAAAPSTLAPVSDAGTAAAAPVSAGSSGISSLTPSTQSAVNAEDPMANMSASQQNAIAQMQNAPSATNEQVLQNAGQASNPSFTSKLMSWAQANPYEAAALGIGGAYTLQGMAKPNYLTPYQPVTYPGLNAQLASGYRPTRAMAEGGITQLADGGDIKVGAEYAPYNLDHANSGIGGLTPSTIESTSTFAEGGIAQYNVGGKLLSGDGDGMSDSIRANIAGHQEARLGDGEFVVPADVVSHLGNGSTDAGAKQLYTMMDRVRQARTGRKAQGKEIKPGKYMPA
jgi:hypothetical protein